MPNPTAIVGEVRGNAVWDTIKFLFGLTGGAGVLTGAYAALTHLYTSASLNLRFIIGVFLASFLFLLIAFILGRMQRRGESQSTQLSPLQQQITPSTEHVQVIKEPCADKWLHDLAEEQVGNLNFLVRVEEIHIQSHDLLGESPFIDFMLPITNRSVYTVRLDEVSGYITFGEVGLNRAPTVRRNDVENLKVNQSMTCFLRQPLDKGEVRSVLNSAGGSFGFGGVKLRLSIMAGDHKIDSREIRLMGPPYHVTNLKILRSYPSLRLR